MGWPTGTRHCCTALLHFKGDQLQATRDLPSQSPLQAWKLVPLSPKAVASVCDVCGSRYGIDPLDLVLGHFDGRSDCVFLYVADVWHVASRQLVAWLGGVPGGLAVAQSGSVEGLERSVRELDPVPCGAGADAVVLLGVDAVGVHHRCHGDLVRGCPERRAPAASQVLRDDPVILSSAGVGPVWT